MRWRDITKEEILSVLNNPEKIEDDIKNRKNAYRLVVNRNIKVTFIEEEGTIVILSVVDKD